MTFDKDDTNQTSFDEPALLRVLLKEGRITCHDSIRQSAYIDNYQETNACNTNTKRSFI
ncbi:hypothetical protein SAMN05421881_100155 [Nitrosomonas halophila]|uniref:Uncharacterized protein n=1 Tax=Nitrosomonas halophila TaxID=44576 RepID=A0A1H3BL13_9PROT|nr:hypothetical protein SAMN05421881_100155 [Nitrosomonas halophila]